ncbi:hypothetical protein TrST_g10259 [Triparma strigata]|uniref:GmrSD restriction endonucleases N-terminal domain-containing protein n=1 Tax=Triparma strigata TaxID=1606541 RepID=A0A9W7DXR8_9STRA|nr:hypothetical protein TrST_g10259 [Triparma strigata]
MMNSSSMLPPASMPPLVQAPQTAAPGAKGWDYLARMKSANQNVICTSKAGQVRKCSVEFLLSRSLRIPIFQRRYCWTAPNWRQALQDITFLATGRKSSHSFGRITCVDAGGAGLVVIDGQQRNTTCVLLLAACRDIALEEGHFALAKSIDGKLFGNKLDKVDEWVQSKKEEGGGSVQIQDGDYIDCCCLIPTYCDRASFLHAVLTPSIGATSDSSWTRPLEAKQYLTQKLREGELASAGVIGLENLKRVITAVLRKIEWLYFPLDVGGKHDDGTEDLEIIFERLALRDAMFCRPPSKSQYAEMASVDFIRNLMLGGFVKKEEIALEMYKTWWLPIETQAGKSAAQENKDGGEVLENLLEAFLVEEGLPVGEEEKGGGTPSIYHSDISKMVGGDLYAYFRDYVTHAKESGMSSEELLIKVHDFGVNRYFAGTYRADKKRKKISVAKGYGRGGSGLELGGSRKCPRCQFSNDASAQVCTACNLQPI